MHAVKSIAAIVAVLAFSALGAVATASAAETLWRWLPGSIGETFKGEQPKEGLVESEKHKVSCQKMKILLTDEGTKASSELVGTAGGKEATLELVLIHYEGCKAEGLFTANTLGDSSGIVLIHAEVHNCVISKAEKRFGLLILPLPLHIEVPVAGLLISMVEKVLYIVELKEETKLKFKMLAEESEGKQAIEKCEGGEAESLKWKVDNEAEERIGLKSETNLELDMTKDKEGETMME